MSRDRRLLKEIKDIDNDSESGVKVTPCNDNLTTLKGTFPGPPDTPYAGGTYQIHIVIPNEYPFKAPTMKFDTKVWHPNVSSQTGAICLDTLSSGWSPVQTIKTTLLSLQRLLEYPNPKDPQDAEVAKMIIEQPKAFFIKAQEWAVKYAGAPKQDIDLTQIADGGPVQVDDENKYMGYNKDLVDRFVTMGFDVEAVVNAFLYVGIDRNGGQDYVLEEAYMGDVTARLLGES